MFTQLCKQHFPIILFRQPIFTSKTYNHAVTYNHASADGNLQNFRQGKLDYGAPSKSQLHHNLY